MIDEIVKSHKRGERAYHVALDMLKEEGLEENEAHELLFPPITEDDFPDPQPFDPNDIMQIKIIEPKGDEEE